MIGAGKKVFSADKPIKFIAAPLLGIIIPNCTGLITNNKYSPVQLLLHYLLFIVIAWLLWEGNVKIMLSLKERLSISAKEYYKSIFILLAAVISFTVISSFITLSVWFYFSKETLPDFFKVRITVAVISVAAIFITNMYENFFS